MERNYEARRLSIHTNTVAKIHPIQGRNESEWKCGGENEIKLFGKNWKTTAGKPRRRHTEKEGSTELLRKSEICQKKTKREPVAPNNYQTGNKRTRAENTTKGQDRNKTLTKLLQYRR